MQSFSFIPFTASEEKIFNIFRKIYPLCCHGNHSNSVIWTKLIWIVEDYSRNITIKKNLNTCSGTAKIANFHFSHYKSMETINFHSNHSSYPIGTKTQLFVPPAYRCYMWNLVRIGFMTSEAMSFENVDGWQMPAYAISLPMSLWLRWAKKQFCTRQSLRYENCLVSTHWRLWSDWVDVQADLSYRWVHRSFC